ncbi:MAG: hypothetical protein AB1295_04275 [Candidatus Micrarchaeota archaeon]
MGFFRKLFCRQAPQMPVARPEDPQLWKPNGKLDLSAVDAVFKQGLRGSHYHFAGRDYGQNCRVEMQPGKTKSALVAFLSGIQPCPTWDAFVGAEHHGIVRITAPSLDARGMLETLRK